MTGDEMRILYLPHNSRQEYFLNFFRRARKMANWRVGVVAQYDSRKNYLGIVDLENDYFSMPDFFRKMHWETDSAERDRLSELIGRCEKLTGISVNRILLAGERDIGRGFSSEAYRWPLNKIGKSVLSNNEFPACILERMFWFADDLLKKFNPNIILTGLTPMPIHFVISLIAEKAGIPFVANRRSKVHSKRVYWTLDRTMFNTQTSLRYKEKARILAPVSETAREIISRFREKPQTVHYIAENWRNGKIEWSKEHWAFILSALARINHFVRGRKGIPPKSVLPRVVEFYRREFLKRLQSGVFRAHQSEELGSFGYIYYPQHKEPELTASFQAPQYHNQKNTIGMLSKILPAGFKLLVREHRFNFGRRPKGYYKSLMRYPGVELIHPLDSQFKYILNADLIVTDNGSTGWEGLLLNRPVITLAQTFYDAPRLTTYVPAPIDLNSTLLGLLRDPQAYDHEDYDRRIGWFLDAERETTFPEDEDHFEESLQIIEKLVSEGSCTNIHFESSVKVQG